MTYENTNDDCYCSSCLNGDWDCSDALCGSTFECPSNLIQSQNITECEPTCNSLHFLNTTHCGGPRWSGIGVENFLSIGPRG